MRVEGYRRSGISTRILLRGILYVAGGTITSAFIAIWLFDIRARDIRISDRESSSQVIANGIAIAIQDDVIARNFAQLESRLMQSMSDLKMLSITVADADGVVLSELQRYPETGSIKPIYSFKKFVAPSTREIVVSDDLLTTRWLELKAGVPIGWLKLEMTSTLIEQELVELRRDVSIALLFACFILLASIGTVLKRTYSLISIEEAFMEGKSEVLEKIAFHDHLTGLPNRLSLMDRIGQAIAYSDRSNKSFAICFIDLDGFKSINDNYGHDIGDLVLKEVATRLKDCVRASDTVARIGGDEFVLLLVDREDGERFEIFLDRVKKSFAEPIRLRSGNLLKVGLSIGVTTYPADSSSPDDLLKHADKAMYKAKKSKDNWFEIYKG